MYFAPMLQFPEWVKKLTPFGYIPNLPVEEINYLRLGLLCAIAVVLTVIGFFAYRKRDLQG
jgi:ABC-2 type transport system permease protein